MYTRSAVTAVSMASSRVAALVLGMLTFPVSALAAAAPRPGSCGFLGSVNDVLNIATVIVVGLAVVIAIYRISFARKRIADVAPILIGGLLIGAAAQVANMVIDKDACNRAVIAMEADQR